MRRLLGGEFDLFRLLFCEEVLSGQECWDALSFTKFWTCRDKFSMPCSSSVNMSGVVVCDVVFVGVGVFLGVASFVELYDVA